MTRLLEGRCAIITGASGPRGLGLATARLFAEHGARVLLLDLDEAATQAAALTLGDGGAHLGAETGSTRHLGARCDVTDKAQCEAAAALALKAFGRIDILFNNAGITSPQRLMEVTPESYTRIMDVNMRGTLYMTQAVVPAMRARKSGSIVNMSSVSAQRGGGVFGGSHYAASKAAMLGYTKATARELAPNNIRVNAICAGYIATDITAGLMSAEQLKSVIAAVPMGRAGEAIDVAGCALFLASDLAAYVTGTEVDVNGGSHIH